MARQHIVQQRLTKIQNRAGHALKYFCFFFGQFVSCQGYTTNRTWSGFLVLSCQAGPACGRAGGLARIGGRRIGMTWPTVRESGDHVLAAPLWAPRVRPQPAASKRGGDEAIPGGIRYRTEHTEDRGERSGLTATEPMRPGTATSSVEASCPKPQRGRPARNPASRPESIFRKSTP